MGKRPLKPSIRINDDARPNAILAANLHWFQDKFSLSGKRIAEAIRVAASQISRWKNESVSIDCESLERLTAFVNWHLLAPITGHDLISILLETGREVAVVETCDAALHESSPWSERLLLIMARLHRMHDEHLGHLAAPESGCATRARMIIDGLMIESTTVSYFNPQGEMHAATYTYFVSQLPNTQLSPFSEFVKDLFRFWSGFPPRLCAEE